jgi:hypothetical protein
LLLAGYHCLELGGDESRHVVRRLLSGNPATNRRRHHAGPNPDKDRYVSTQRGGPTRLDRDALVRTVESWASASRISAGGVLGNGLMTLLELKP